MEAAHRPKTLNRHEPSRRRTGLPLVTRPRRGLAMTRTKSRRTPKNQHASGGGAGRAWKRGLNATPRVAGRATQELSICELTQYSLRFPCCSCSPRWLGSRPILVAAPDTFAVRGHAASEFTNRRQILATNRNSDTDINLIIILNRFFAASIPIAPEPLFEETC